MTDKTITRRDLLKTSGLIALGVGGALGVGLAARGTTVGVYDVGEGAPYDAWDHLPDDGSPQSLVAAAILAANPHNTQAWRFALSDDVIRISPDRRRSLPATDPSDIELVMGLGCALENLVVAAAAAGRTVTSSTDSSGVTLAKLSEQTRSPQKGSDLFPAITRRHTNRGPYLANLTLPDSALDSGSAVVMSLPTAHLTWLTADARDQFGQLVVAATQAVISDRAQSDEINRWWRGTRADIDLHRDGMTIDAQGLPPVTTFLAKMLPPTSQAANDASWLANTRQVHVPTAAAFGLVSLADPTSPAEQIDAGRAFQRLHLWATTQGLAMHPLNQVIERINRDRAQGRTSQFEAAVRDLTPAGRTAVLAFRIGVPTVAPRRSPRRPITDVLS